MREFLDRMLALTAEAMSAHPGSPDVRRFGSATVSMRCTNTAFRGILSDEITLPRSLPSDSDLRIEVWDCASTGIEPPALPHFVDPAAPYEFAADGFIIDPNAGSALIWDEATRHAVLWARDLTHPPEWYRAAPLRLLLTILGPLGDAVLVHGSAVEYEGRAAVLIGASGSGKSTTARLAELAGATHFADDQVVAYRLDGRFVADPLYRARKMQLDNAQLPNLTPHHDLTVVHTSSTKSVLRPVTRTEFPAAVPVAALITPDLSSGEPLTPVSSPAMFQRLLHACMQDGVVSDARVARSLLSLAQGVACLSLGLARPTDDIASDVLTFLGGHHG
ncbi:MAG: hypothetical protein NTZ03_00395 [Actinobacteria bacterium]|nr:hypothetical protein [Actinomycetota bacterium]